MKSMTGYGLGQAESSTSRIEVSLRIVNGRFLESRMHMPREFIAYEADLKKKLGSFVERGTADIFVNRKLNAKAKSQNLVLNANLAKQYYAALKSLSKELRIANKVSLEGLAKMPEVLHFEDAAEITSEEKKSLMLAFERACKACDLERKREGKSLRQHLEQNLEILGGLVEKMEDLRTEANKNLLERFTNKLKSRNLDVQVDPQRISQEIVVQLERSDIDEEITRLREHLKNYKNLLASEDAQGKKLDFYTQELLREINTVGSKSGVSQLTQVVVEAKTVVEKLREQIQNVE
jgi:uncharacterized protein (TIGR00255 family)